MIEIVFAACFVILNTGCGLDEYYVITEPASVHVPALSGAKETGHRDGQTVGS